MEIKFEVIATLLVDYTPEVNKSSVIGSFLQLGCSPFLDKSAYINSNGSPTRDGSDVLTKVLVNALVGNIHHAHQTGIRDSAEHLRAIIAELENGFVQVGTVIEVMPSGYVVPGMSNEKTG